MTPHRFASVQPNAEWLSNTTTSDPSDVTLMFDDLLDEIEDEDLTYVFSEFLVPEAE